MASHGADKKLVVCHAVKGRLRIKFPSLRWSEAGASAFAVWLLNRSGIEEAAIRRVTGSIIIRYDPRKNDGEAILARVREASAEFWDRTGNRLPSPAPHRALVSKPLTPFGFMRLLWVFGVTAFAVFGLVREIFFKRPLAQGMLSPTGLVALIGTVPILRHGISQLLKKRGIGLYVFLGGASLVAIFAGQATAALEVVWVTSLSMLIEEYVADKSKRAIRESLEMRVLDACVIVDGEEREVPLSEVKKGDIVSVRSGERIPVDGRVVHGEALVDEAHLTGRSEPELRTIADSVYAGTLVKHGSLAIASENVGKDTYIDRMLERAEIGLLNRAPVERKADVLARRLTLLGSAATLGTLLLTGRLSRVLTVLLLAACPCATALAASTAISAAIANAARKRVFIKGGLYLENIARIDCFCFDKTGTLTIERSVVEEVIDLTPAPDRRRILRLASAAEARNPHPIASAIVNEAQKAGIKIPLSTSSEVALGRGVSVRVGDDTILAGNARLLQDHGVEIDSVKKQAADSQYRGRTVVYIAKNGILEGLITVSNEVRSGTASVLAALREDGVREIHLVTGDLTAVAEVLASELCLDGHGALLSPDEKAAYVERLKRRGLHVAMVGDGVNDAVALTAANIGIAMGAGGSEAALEAGDIALADSDLAGLPMLRRLSRDSLRIVEQNHWLAVSTNLVGMALGATGAIGPVTAGLIHVLHTLGIMMNSGRLLNWRPSKI